MRSSGIRTRLMALLIAVSVGAFGAHAFADEAPAKININTADAAEMTKFPGIGDVKAKAIVDYRTEKGPFKSCDDLINVKGIGPKTLEKIKPMCTVGDAE